MAMTQSIQTDHAQRHTHIEINTIQSINKNFGKTHNHQYYL